MKKLHSLWAACILLTGLLMTACSKTDPAPTVKTDNWTKDTVLKQIQGEWKIAKVLRVAGQDTVEVNLPGFSEWNPSTVIILESPPSVLNYAFGLVHGALTQGPYYDQYKDILPPGGELHAIGTRIRREELGVNFNWDDALNTVVFKSREISVPLLPVNRTAVLDRTSFVMYKSFEEAKTAQKHTNMTLVTQEVDPVLGNVHYLFVLRKLWFIAPVNDSFNTYIFALY